jgi:drug/metabolite transporter (DMT)-like permease
MHGKQTDRKAMSTQLRETDSDRLIGIGLICVTLLSFAFLDSIAKLLSPTLPALQIIWARYAGNVLVVAVFINYRTYPGVLRTKKPKIQWTRSVLLLLSTSMNFIALRYLQLAETSSIAFTIPL